jgi:hypothetical protein
MGNIISPQENETVVLVPPRFSVRGLTRPLEIENPMSVYFGNLFRKEVLADLHNFSGSLAVDLLIAPETPPKVAAHVSMKGSSVTRSVEGGELHLHLNHDFSNSLSSIGRLCVGSGSGLSGFAMISKQLEQGRVSFTYSGDSENERKVGLRASSDSFTIGLEVPVHDPVLSAQAWLISRVSPELYVGVSGQPLGSPESPILLAGSFEKRIPGTDSSYCVSSVYKMPSNELTLGFSQHLVTHRKVYNILEDKRVKFIANYVDIAVEATTHKSGFSDVSAGVSWQINKNLLVKLHASTNQGLVSTLAVRNWWIPSVLTSVSAGIDRAGDPFIGGRFQLSNWLTSAEYQKGQPISTLPTTKWVVAADIDRFSNRNQL